MEAMAETRAHFINIRAMRWPQIGMAARSATQSRLPALTSRATKQTPAAQPLAVARLGSAGPRRQRQAVAAGPTLRDGVTGSGTPLPFTSGRRRLQAKP